MKYILRFLAFFKKGFWMCLTGTFFWLFHSFSQSFLRFWPTVSEWMGFYLRNHDGTTGNIVYSLVNYTYAVTEKLEVILSQLSYWLPLETIFNTFMGLVGFSIQMAIVKIFVMSLKGVIGK